MTLEEAIQQRRSVFPAQYDTEKTISDTVLTKILESAIQAPTHKRTEPWSFKVLRGGALSRLSDFMIADYEAHTPEAEQRATKKLKRGENPLKSACVIAICMKTHPDIVPEWEEIAAVAMAVQNMWLTCTAEGIGAYWSSPDTIHRMGSFLNLEANERCLGLFYMGYSVAPISAAKRSPLSEKVEWVNE